MYIYLTLCEMNFYLPFSMMWWNLGNFKLICSAAFPHTLTAPSRWGGWAMQAEVFGNVDFLISVCWTIVFKYFFFGKITLKVHVLEMWRGSVSFLLCLFIPQPSKHLRIRIIQLGLMRLTQSKVICIKVKDRRPTWCVFKWLQDF